MLEDRKGCETQLEARKRCERRLEEEQLLAQIHSALPLWEYFRLLHSLAQNKTPSSKKYC